MTILITKSHRHLALEAEMADAVGVAADYHRPNGYSERSMGWSETREIGATVKAFLDILIGREPTVSDDTNVVYTPGT